MATYSEKLKDPRWQKRRLEILQRDNFTCRMCSDDKSTLHVHHIAYNGEPWEALDKQLLTLCQECHKNESEFLKSIESECIRELKKAGFTGSALYDLKKVFKDTDRGWGLYEPAFDILKMVVDDDVLWNEMQDLFFKRLRS